MRRAACAALLVIASTSRAQSPTGQEIAQARQYPDTIRARLSDNLRSIASASRADHRSAALLRARSLANAYARAWNDSFHVREVAWFASLAPPRQLEFAAADSLRKAGNDILSSRGALSAMPVWRGALARSQRLGHPAAVAPIFASIGAGYYRMNRYDSALWYLRNAEAISQKAGDHRTLGNAIGIIASVQKDQGRVSSALESYKRAARVRALSGDTRGIAADENNIGTISLEQGALADARGAFNRALAINRRERRDRLAALNLLNLGIIERNSAEYARAEQILRESLRLYRSGGASADEAFVHHELGKVHASRGDYEEALSEYRIALRGYESAGAASDALSARADIAAVQSAAGDPQAARSTLSAATQAARAPDIPPQSRASLAIARADLAISFSTFSEAEEEYAAAARLYQGIGSPSGRARALEGQALLAYWRGQNDRAFALLAAAQRAYTSSGDKRAAALTGLLSSKAMIARGDTAGGRRVLIAARNTLRLLGDRVGEAAALAGLGELEILSRKMSAAAGYYRAGFAALGSRPASDVRWRLHYGFGEALRASGSRSAAAAEFRSAISVGETEAATLRLEERRSGILAEKWSVYTDLAFLEKDRRRTADAFAVSELMRARQMRDLLARGRVARAAPASMNEQDLRRRIAYLTRQIEAPARGFSGAREAAIATRATEEIRKQLDSAQKAYAGLLLDIRESDPVYSAVVTGGRASWNDIARRLASDQVMIEYLLADSASIAFVMTRDTIAAIDIGASRERIVNLVEFSRKTMDSPGNMSRKALWRASLRSLYTTLIWPIEKRGLLHGKKQLLIIPHAELHFLSFASLIGPGAGARFLVESYDIAYSPSAAIWVALEQRTQHRTQGRVVAFAPNVDRLPGSRKEVEAVSRIYGRNALVRFGSAATRGSLEMNAADASVIHLATFGVLNKHNPLFSFVALAPSANDDGKLAVHDVFGLPLRGQTVILSACQTALASGALADVPAGDDWVGLVQAFLNAGARSVVATLWPVEDRATSDLMTEFHQRLARGASTASALAGAQRTMIRTAKSNPVYWAGFTLSGRSR